MSNKEKYYRLVEQYGGMLWSICASYCLDSAWEVRDAYQEVLVALWNSLDTLRDSRREKAWVHKVASNTMLMLMRRQHGVRTVSLSPDEEQLLATKATASAQTDYEELLRLIDRLAEPDRSIVTMRLDGFSYREISEEVGLGENAAAQRYKRAIKKLRQQYEDEF